jgi:hypothetical protein
MLMGVDEEGGGLRAKISRKSVEKLPKIAWKVAVLAKILLFT